MAYIDSVAVIGDLEELEAAFFDEDFERGGTGVDGVFHELFEGMDWSDNDLSGCDLVYDIWMKCLSCVRIMFCTGTWG